MKKIKKTIFSFFTISFCLVILFSLSANVQAGAIYVPTDYSTIQEAIDAAQAGDLVVIGNGVYSKNTNGESFPIQINNKKDIYIIGESLETIVDGEDSGRDIDVFEVKNSENITFLQLFIRNAGQAGIMINYSYNIKIADCHILNAYEFAVSSGFSSLVLVDHNYLESTLAPNGPNWGFTAYESDVTVTNNTITGFYTSSSLGGVGGLYIASDHQINEAFIKNNLIYNCNVGISGRDTHITIENNTISHSFKNKVPPYWGGVGIFIGPRGEAVIKNNIISNNESEGIYIYEMDKVSLLYNNVWGNGLDYDGINPGASDISADPYFLKPFKGGSRKADYHLDNNIAHYSPSIDAGDPRSNVGLEPQPNGDRINQGAYGGTPEAEVSLIQKTIYPEEKDPPPVIINADDERDKPVLIR